MFEQKTLENLNEYFNDLSARAGQVVYFYRLNGYNENIQNFIFRYYEAARQWGVIIEGGIPNPDRDNLAYYEEVMGLNFQHSLGFITDSLKRWMPRLTDSQRHHMGVALYDVLDSMKKEGKNPNVLKNAYIKFMCWLYYKFERMMNQLGNNRLPKILYEGNINAYELRLLTVLSLAGCDIVLLQYHGDAAYLKIDEGSRYSKPYTQETVTAFPREFNIGWVRQELGEQVSRQRLYGALPKIKNCTNAWIEGKGLEDVLKSPSLRGGEQDFFYNCFIRIHGVWDKSLYQNDLYQFQLQLKSSKRPVVVVEAGIDIPTVEEINGVQRKNYQKKEDMLLHLSANIQYPANIELQRMMVKAFIDVLMEESKKSHVSFNKLTNQAVYLLCWLRRYQSQLFVGWKMPEIGCFIYLGGCKSQEEALFIKLLSKLPVDILILVPDLNQQCVLQDSLLYEQKFTNSMTLSQFPKLNSHVQISTAAHQAERDLDSLMYQDSGMYRHRQHQQAMAINLQTMYEEIEILWDQELKYRPSFSVVEDMVNMPVIFAKVSGVKNGHVPEYWAKMKALKTANTLVIKDVPYINTMTPNSIKGHATEFLKNRRLQKDKIKKHSVYRYGFLREEAQNYILDKLEMLLEQKTIIGTYENGVEYTIVSTILNMDKELLRMIQNFDFTKKNPKVLYINTKENGASLEDGILMAFLHLIGFDIVFFVPTGYQGVEKFYQGLTVKEHQNGEYVYDLRVPDFDRIMASNSNRQQSWRDIIFKRGR